MTNLGGLALLTMTSKLKSLLFKSDTSLDFELQLWQVKAHK